MKTVLTLLFFSTITHAHDYAGLGNFEGELFTGASIHSSFSLNGGTYSSCEVLDGNMGRCTVENGRIEVRTNRGLETFTLSKVVILKTRNGAKEHHYFRATRPLKYGSKDLQQAASITVNWYSEQKDRVFGFIDLSELQTRSGFEAYRKD